MAKVTQKKDLPASPAQCAQADVGHYEGFDATSTSELLLSLAGYDDLFSDFDPRPYSVRSLSEDFLYEARRGAIGKDHKLLWLTLVMPKAARNRELEDVIIARLHKHFKKHYELQHLKSRMAREKGFVMLFIGALIGIIATAMFDIHTTSPYLTFLFIILEPASWFTMWTGFERIFIPDKQDQEALEFYRKLADSKIQFISC